MPGVVQYDRRDALPLQRLQHGGVELLDGAVVALVAAPEVGPTVEEHDFGTLGCPQEGIRPAFIEKVHAGPMKEAEECGSGGSLSQPASSSPMGFSSWKNETRTPLRERAAASCWAQRDLNEPVAPQTQMRAPLGK